MARSITYIDTPPKQTKEQEHSQIQKQIDEFLKKGGRIIKVPIGETIYNSDGSKKFGYREEN